MPSKAKVTGIRLTEEQNYKIRYIAEKNYRTLNDEFKMIVDKHIQLYELQNGEIKLPEN